MKDKITKSPSKNMSPYSNVAHIIIISCIAIFVLLGVSIYFKNSSHQNKRRDGLSIAPKAQSDMVVRMQGKLPAPKNEMIAPNATEITGKWFTSFGKSSIAELVLINKKFELIYTDDPKWRNRKYSRGNYKYNEQSGKLTLSPDKHTGTPKVIKGVAYKVLTNRNFDIFISKKTGDNNLYFSAPEYQIIPKSFHPLFLYADYSGAPVIKFLPISANKGK